MTFIATPTVVHLTQRPPRQIQEARHESIRDFWWSTDNNSMSAPPTITSNGDTLDQPSTLATPTFTSTPLPTSEPTALPSSDLSRTSGPLSLSPTSIGVSDSAALSRGVSTSIATITSFVPVPVTEPFSTFTSLSQSLSTSTEVITALPASQTASFDLRVDPVCIGHGIDTSSLGLISTVVVPSAIGLLLWLLFAIIRPRYRQVYALREWFVQPDLRPKPLGRSLWAFLFPHVPLVPSVPTDVSDTGKSSARDADLFPSDEALSQRTLWLCLVIVFGWTILALAAFLPLYMVSTPCLAHSVPLATFAGAYSLLQDLSILRLLQLLDNRTVTTTTDLSIPGFSREVVNGRDVAQVARTRVIILTVLAIVLGLLPMLWKLIREFNRMVAYRQRWVDFRCQGQEMGWLSARRAPGFVGWGERRLKEFIVKTGLSESLQTNGDRNNQPKRRHRNQMLQNEEKGSFEVDVQNLFSIGDTTHLALLIDERDEILENLEIAETKYISSFRLSTPDPSVADFAPLNVPMPGDLSTPPRPQISRPRPLAGSSQNRRRRRGRNPAHGSSSLPPTSFVLPSQYYRLRGMEGIGGGELADVEAETSRPGRGPSLTDSFTQRIVGSRFQEVNRNSLAFGRIPLGSQVAVEKNGQFAPVRTESPLPDTALYGPNAAHSSWDTAAFNEGPHDHEWFMHGGPETIPEALEEEDWVDVLHEAPEAFENGEEYDVNALARRRPRPPRVRNAGTPSEERRETFPLRNRNKENGEAQPPPHLRLQPRQPFVRPLSGLDMDDLGHIYADIGIWRSKLKAINAEIAEVQGEGYNDIADGIRIKGWLLIGRGLRFLPGVELIEGRAKEDVRWDELQNQGGPIRTLAYWTIIITIGIILGVSLTAVAALSVATAPDVAHYLPFFLPLATANGLGSGVATGLVSAVAATLFITVALGVVHYAGHLSQSVSVSGTQLTVYRTIFYILTIVSGIWLFVAGAFFFSMRALSTMEGQSESVANGAIYMSAFAMMLVVNVAIIFPALLMLQPRRLWHVLRTEKDAVTPRQRFRAVYPRSYNPSYATCCCILAVFLASAFSLIFPLLAPAAFLLLFLTLIAHRYLIGYVYGRTHSQTGGLLQIWLLKRLGSLLAFQPLLLGLILLSRDLWIEGGVLCGAALFVFVFVEAYCTWRARLPGRKSLSAITKDSLDGFAKAAKPNTPRDVDEESTSLVSSARNTRARGSFASVLEMMSLTLAVMPSSSQSRGPVPLETETLNDLTATERAARTHPDAPPHLPQLSFTDHAEEMSGILYAPELLAPAPVIWLPNDAGGIGRSEAYDLERYHNLHVTLDVRAKEDVLPRRSTSSQARRARSAS